MIQSATGCKNLCSSSLSLLVQWFSSPLLIHSLLVYLINFLILVLKLAINLQPTSPLFPPSQHSVCLQPIIILALTRYSYCPKLNCWLFSFFQVHSFCCVFRSRVNSLDAIEIQMDSLYATKYFEFPSVLQKFWFILSVPFHPNFHPYVLKCG